LILVENQDSQLDKKNYMAEDEIGSIHEPCFAEHCGHTIHLDSLPVILDRVQLEVISEWQNQTTNTVHARLSPEIEAKIKLQF